MFLFYTLGTLAGAVHRTPNWQDRYHGSIDIIEVVIHDYRKKLDELPIIECIHIRRACWDYLETNGLYLTTQMIPLSLYSPVENTMR